MSAHARRHLRASANVERLIALITWWENDGSRTASVDGTNFYGTCMSRSTGAWIDRALDLSSVTTLGNQLGQPNVWIALIFESNSSVTRSEGGYVDNIALRKCTGGTCVGANVFMS